MVIDLTGLGNNQKQEQEEEEQEVCCQLCPTPVKMLYCNQDNIDKSQGPLYKKGDHVCPKCGNVKMGKKKEQKGPKITKKASKGFIGIGMFSTNPDHGLGLGLDSYLASRRLEEENYQIDTFGDEYLEEQGATITETQVYNPVTGRTITRSQREENASTALVN